MFEKRFRLKMLFFVFCVSSDLPCSFYLVAPNTYMKGPVLLKNVRSVTRPSLTFGCIALKRGSVNFCRIVDQKMSEKCSLKKSFFSPKVVETRFYTLLKKVFFGWRFFYIYKNLQLQRLTEPLYDFRVV
mgnify:CR=1 FL=1